MNWPSRSTSSGTGGEPGSMTASSRLRVPAFALTAVLVASAFTFISSGLDTLPANAAYATGGSGLYKGSIDWFEWGTRGERIPAQGITRTNTRAIAGQTLSTTCTLGAPSAGGLKAYAAGTWTGDGLDDMYNIGGVGANNRLVAGLANYVISGAQVDFTFSCAATLDGVPVPLAGLVMADAEASGPDEFIQATIPAGGNWRIIDRHRSADCLGNTPAIRAGQTLRLTGDAQSSACSTYPTAVAFMEGATSANVSIKGGGASAVALGTMLFTDFGDGPASYGDAGALYSPSFVGGAVAAGTTQRVFNTDFALATPGQPVTRLGATVDSEEASQPSEGAIADGDTDDAVTLPSSLLVAPGGTYTLPDVQCTGPGFVAGWVDWNSNGVFDDGERSSSPECTGTSVDLTWNVPADAVDGASYLRVRIAALADSILLPTGITTSGEVEDYAVSIAFPQLSVAKTSDASKNARPGDTVKYTVSVTNKSTVDFTDIYPATLRDDLSGVIDDADYNVDATATIDGANAGPVALSHSQLVWSGALGAGKTATLSYSVTLKGGGDGRVRNVAWVPITVDSSDPPSCDPADASGLDPVSGEPCAETELFLPQLAIAKSADRHELPVIGDSVTYTITATNTSDADFTADAPATVTDDLTKVLDDADFANDAVASRNGVLNYAAPKLSWVGPLAAGESVTISYTVKYTAKGDKILINSACVPVDLTAQGAPSCDFVSIPGADLTQWKSVTASSNPVVAGTELSYTLFFKNSGQTAAAIDAIDDLTHVLDDADVKIEPTSAQSLTATRTNERIAITGAVPVGKTYSVSYTAIVRPDGKRGDDIAANFLLQNDPITVPQTPEAPSECKPVNSHLPNCTVTPIAAVTYNKTVQASSNPVSVGTILNYTITIQNTGAATAAVSRDDVLTDVLDDAKVAIQPKSNAKSVSVTPISDDKFSIGGTLAAGATATVTYSVTVNDEGERGNNSAANFIVAQGETPPTSCQPVGGENADCTITLLPNVTSVKSADPKSGSTVVAGQVVTYTLGFTNKGEAEGAVNYVDYLTDVLDDADITLAPSSVDGALEVTKIVNGQFAIRGTLAAGQTSNVSYQVTVKADGKRGDNSLGNVLAKPGRVILDPNCEIGDPNCTVNPVPNIVDTKSVNPASKTPVVAGDELVYTLNFTNTGRAAGKVDKVDDFTHLIDDAAIIAEPISSRAALSVTKAGNQYLITGTLAPGESVTVSYKVKVKEEADRGDSILANYLFKPGSAVPAEPVCAPTADEEADCTVNPVGVIKASKTVDPKSGTVVETGRTLSYTLSFANTAKGSAAVNYTDHLAGVLDDAAWLGNIKASHGLTISGPVKDALLVTGQVPAGETATVTYQVKVKELAAQGNRQLANYITVTGEQPPASCVAENPLCTQNPTGKLSSGLASTGAEGQLVLLLGLLLLLGGGGILLATRRRRPSDESLAGEEHSVS